MQQATSNFSIKWYYKNGNYIGTTDAEYVKGKYQINAFLESAYYAALVNNSSSAAKNATYIAN